MSSDASTLMPIIGGAAGFMLGGPAGAAAGASIGGMIGGQMAGADAAAAQGDAAQAQLRQQQADRKQALALAQPSPQELQQLQASVAANQADYDRKLKILESTDPAIIEAGKQALSLMQGTEASTLNPIRNQRAKDRAQLANKLRSQLGSGYETSTAGQQALSEFDAQTSGALAQAQQSSLGQLLGVANQYSAAGTQSNISNFGNLSSLYGNIQGRQAAALSGTPITASGAPFVQDYLNAQNQQNLMNQVTQAGTTAATLGYLYPSPASGTTPKVAVSTPNVNNMGSNYQGVHL